MLEIIEQIKMWQNKLAEASELLNLSQKKQKILELEEQMSQPNFWQDQNQAKASSQELAGVKNFVSAWEKLNKDLEELADVAEESERAEDDSLKNEMQKKLIDLENEFKDLEFKLMLSGKYDQNQAVVAIHAGTGGVDAMDWAEMLERVYLRWAEKHNFKINIIDRQTGGEAGIKSVIFEAKGLWAYGYLKSEAGVHRLVRISPYDAEKMRHTSFALVEVLPELGEAEEYQLKDDDLEIDTFRSSGHGGQSVNTTDSAVRIKHKPTGIVVNCQNERSQLQNKQTALKILAAKVKQYNEVKEEEERKKLRGEFSEAAWGNQIRSYVLQPYKLVKDHRTDYETTEVEAVLNGEIDEFIRAYLREQVKKR